MKKKKLLFLVSIFAVALLFLAACGDGNGTDTDTDVTATTDTGTDATDITGGDSDLPDGLYVDANGNYRFEETRTISVALWDRNHDRIPNFDESAWADWVVEQMLEVHNIAVEWRTVPRWPNDYEAQSILIAAGEAADVGYTFNNANITTFAEMGGIHNLYPLLQDYGHLLPNMYGLLGRNVYHNLNPDTGDLWTITGWNNNATNGRTTTWIREDWLNVLDLPIPTTLEEFEATLTAFRDRAAELPGVGETGSVTHRLPEEDWENEDEPEYETTYFDLTASDIIPFLMTQDVGWTASTLFESFIDPNISEREWFVNGFDDRRFHFEEAMREGTRVLNRWFNEDLIFHDFAITENRDSEDRIRLGHVGATVQNWDMPFRGGDGWTRYGRENINDDVNWIPITPFLNVNDEVQQFVPNPTDRFIFLPETNDQKLASLLYIDFLSRPETIRFLQIGEEGMHHEVLEDGSIAMLDQTDIPNEWFQPSGMNFDITLTVNNLGSWQFDGDEDFALTALSRAYPGIEPEAVLHAREIGTYNNIMFRNVILRTRVSESGMAGPLSDLRNQIFHRMIAQVSPENFDAEWEREYEIYLNTGGRAIIDERDQAWVEAFGDVDTMPE